VNRLSLSSYNLADPSSLGSDVRGSCAGRSGHCCDHCSNSSGRLCLRRSDLVSIHFTRHSFPGPRRDDLTNYWAHGPFVRSFILLVDPGVSVPHICPFCSIGFILHQLGWLENHPSARLDFSGEPLSCALGGTAAMLVRSLIWAVRRRILSRWPWLDLGYRFRGNRSGALIIDRASAV
jgi:hypothetical protein